MRGFSFFILLTAAFVSACGSSEGNNAGATAGAAAPEMSVRIAAAQQTAAQNAQCQAVSPFYYEIGAENGAIVSGSVGGNAYTQSTQMRIASASKWLFGAYVAEVRGGVLAATDVQATSMRSGYVSMGNFCLASETVETCFVARSNDTYTPSSLDRFNYNGGHFQKWGVDNGLALMTGPQVASQYAAVLGSDIAVTFNGPLLAGGAIMTAGGYAIFLRKILNGQLQIAGLLGFQETCTLPGACSTSEYSPVPEAWSYSVGHWIEDDPVTGDGAFSSAGAFGFYPWIDATKTYYGILAREDAFGSAMASVACGRNIRTAFMTSTVQ